jgi:hypothetical protein
VDRPKQNVDFRDGINDKFNSTIFEDKNYGRIPGKVKKYSSDPNWRTERAQAYKSKLSKPTKRLARRGQDSPINSEDMGIGPRNPDGSKHIVPKNIPSSHVRPS